MNHIIEKTCEVCNVTPEDFFGRDPIPSVVLARRVCVVAARRAGYSLPIIASAMRRRSHSTIHGQYETSLRPENWRRVAPLVALVLQEAKSA